MIATDHHHHCHQPQQQQQQLSQHTTASTTLLLPSSSTLSTSLTESQIFINNNNHLYHHHQQQLQLQRSYPNMDNEHQGITKRTVIIHKDPRGYGMRISGDNPVFIQHVNEEGAAYKAGVRSGDQIVKVNGTLVTRMGHAKVVEMIQSCGAFVGLTLHTTSTNSLTASSVSSNSDTSSMNNTNNNNGMTNATITSQSSTSSDITLRHLSPTNSPTPPNNNNNNQSSGINNSASMSSSFGPNHYSSMYPMNMVVLTSNNPIQITGPQPVPESTQQHYHENQIRTLKEMINKEHRHLEELKLMCAKQSDLDSCQKRINEMTSKLEMHQSNIAAHINNINHSRQHSFENSSTFVQDFSTPIINQHQRSNSSSDHSIIGSNSKSPRIMPMDDDVDIDAENSGIYPYEYIENIDRQLQQPDQHLTSATKSLIGIAKSVSNPSVLLRPNSGNRDKVKRDSKIMPILETPSPSSPLPSSVVGNVSILNPKSWYNIHLDSLRMSRYLIQHKMQPPNELLFYVMARNVFPRIVTSTAIPVGNKFQVIQRWAYQIIATFVTKESPLFMQEFPPDYLEQFDRNLTALISANPSATDIIASPFDPFLMTIYETLRKQWEEFMLATSSMSQMMINSNPKHDLQAIIEMLFTTHTNICMASQQQPAPTMTTNSNMKIDLRDIDPILDSFVALVKSHQSESTMALISSLLAIGRYIFQMTTSKHCLLLECSGPGSSSSLSSTLLNSNSNTNFNSTQVPTLNPLLKLSSESSRSSKSGHKRNSMIPIGSKSFTSATHSLGNSFDSSLLASLTNGKLNKNMDSQLQSNVGGSGIGTGSSSNIVGNIASSNLLNSGFTIEDRSHSFVSIVEMNQIIYCTSCMLPMWGDPYTWKCTKCLMYAHQWCRKIAAANNICNNDTHHHQHQQQNSFSSQTSQTGGNNKNNRRIKSEKKSVFEKFSVGKRRRNHPSDFNIGTSLARTQSSCSSSSSTSSISSENSSSDLEDFILSNPTTTTNNNYKNITDEVGSMISNKSVNQESTNNTMSSTSTAPNLVNRSGSFVQRKKKKSSTSVGSPRKRSDPALTSRQMISTMANKIMMNMMIDDVGTNNIASTSGTLPQLTSARSSGALMNSASVGAHDSVQFRPITGQRAKHMAASDSSLMSVTSKSLKSPQPIPSSSSGIPNSTNTESQKSSSTNLTSTSSPRRTRHRNTNDSAIQMDGSSEDDIDDQQLNENETPATTLSNEIDGEKTIPSPIPPPPLPPPLTSLVPPPLPPRPDSQTEKRRQIQMEIIQTEEEHYEVLRHIRKIYQKPLKKEKLFSSEQIDIIFGNIKELRLIHKKIFVKMSLAHKLQMQSKSSDSYHLEESLHDIFCGELGTQLEQEASKFCVNRKIRNGTELWNQRKKDSRLRQWVDSECRTRAIPDNPLARLGLDDLLSRVFQRPLRYPLLFERLLKSTPKDSPGHRYLEQVMICIRRSNERINEETKKAELRSRLVELIRKTDFSNSSVPVNLEHHELLHEGPLVWRITKQKLVDVLLVLTDQIILVLTRDSNDRYVLRTHTNPTTKHEHRPHVKMDDLLMRDVATDQSAFFLVSKNQDIIYEFAAQTTSERKKWKEVITDAINKYRDNRSIPHQLQSQRSFTSSRSMTMMDLKSTTNDLIASNHPHNNNNPHHHHQPPPLPPPIQNRPLPKPPIDSQQSSSSSPPPIPPPSALSFANRPLPQPPSDSTQPPPLPSTPYPTRVDGNVQVVTANERHPSNVDFIPFSQVKITSEQNRSGKLNRNKTDDLQEISDNLQNMIQERRRSGIRNYEDLAREIHEMSLVYDVAKHDDSKEILIRLITDMFRKATEWSYHLIQDNDPAKQELSQRVRNSVESFVKSHIDSNFILPLPSDDIDSNVECTETLFDNCGQPSTSTNDDNNVVSSTPSSSIVESVITPMMANVRLSASAPTAPRPQQMQNRIRRSLSDNYEKSDKTQKTGLELTIHDDDQDSNLTVDESNDNNYDIVTEENFLYNSTTQQPDSNNFLEEVINDSPGFHSFDNTQADELKSRNNSSANESTLILSPIPLASSSSNPFISSKIEDSNIDNMTPTTNIEIKSLGVTEEFVVVLDDGDIIVGNEESDHQLQDIEQQQTANSDDNEVISNDNIADNSSISNIDEQTYQTNNNTNKTTTSQMYLI